MRTHLKVNPKMIEILKVARKRLDEDESPDVVDPDKSTHVHSIMPLIYDFLMATLEN